jgi:hypothetical protein
MWIVAASFPPPSNLRATFSGPRAAGCAAMYVNPTLPFFGHACYLFHLDAKNDGPFRPLDQP